MPRSLDEWALLVGLIVTVATFIGILIRVATHVSTVAYQMTALRKEWYDGDGTKPPIKDQLDTISQRVESADYNSRENHGGSAMDRQNQRIDNFSSRLDQLGMRLTDFMQLMYREQKHMTEKIDKLDERLDNEFSRR